MSGWKTWTAAGLFAASAALRYLGYASIADVVENLATGLGLVGIGHKIEKTGILSRQ